MSQSGATRRNGKRNGCRRCRSRAVGGGCGTCGSNCCSRRTFTFAAILGGRTTTPRTRYKSIWAFGRFGFTRTSNSSLCGCRTYGCGGKTEARTTRSLCSRIGFRRFFFLTFCRCGKGTGEGATTTFWTNRLNSR